MKPSDYALGFIIITLIILSFFLGGMIGEDNMANQAVSHNAAHYDTATGRFTWNK